MYLRGKNIFYTALVFLAFLFAILIYLHNSAFFIDGPMGGFLSTKSEVVRKSIYIPFFYMHVTTGGLVLVSGSLQLVPFVRQTFLQFHRKIGKVYSWIILLFTAPSGMVMAFYANGGPLAKLGFALLAALWWYFTFRGYRYAVRRKIESHQIFMIRSYALTFAALTLRLYSFFFVLLGFKGELAYNVIVWLSWVPTLMVVEIAFMIKGKFAFLKRLGTNHDRVS